MIPFISASWTSAFLFSFLVQPMHGLPSSPLLLLFSAPGKKVVKVQLDSTAKPMSHPAIVHRTFYSHHSLLSTTCLYSSFRPTPSLIQPHTEIFHGDEPEENSFNFSDLIFCHFTFLNQFATWLDKWQGWQNGIHGNIYLQFEDREGQL